MAFQVVMNQNETNDVAFIIKSTWLAKEFHTNWTLKTAMYFNPPITYDVG